MRRKDKAVTEPARLHQVIAEAEICRLGLVDGETPYVLPISFGFDGTSVYFHSAAAGRKVEILKANNRVCLEFEGDCGLIKKESYCSWGVRYITVICQGRAELLTDSAEKNYGLTQIIRQYDKDAPEALYSDEKLASVLVYKVEIREMSGKEGK